MATNTSGAVDQIVSDFNKLKPDQDFSGVAAELVALQSADHTHFQANLAEINKQVDMKKLGFDEDFQIVGIKGNEFVARSEDGTHLEFRQMNNMNSGQAVDNVGKMQPVGDNGRQMLVRPDGSATYVAQANQGDCYWRVAGDVLKSRSGQPPTDTQVANFVNELAAYNNKTDPDKLAVGEKIEIPPPVVAAADPPAAPAAPGTPPAAPGDQPAAPATPPATPGDQPAAPGTPPPAPGADVPPGGTAPSAPAAPGADLRPVAPEGTLTGPDIPATGPDVPASPATGEGVPLDAPALAPQGDDKDIYNPMAPPGQGQGTFGEEWSDGPHGIAASRKLTGTEQDTASGSKTDHYRGYLDDGRLFGLTDTGFRADETIDSQGLLTHRKIQYDSGWGLPSMQFQTPDGAISIKHVFSVETTRDLASSIYNTVIENFEGSRWQAVSGPDGKVMSFTAIDKDPGGPFAPK